MSDREVEEFLAHHGVQGMKWGVRRRAPRGDFKSRNKRQKAALIGGGVAGWIVSGKVTNKVLGRRMPLTQIAVGAISSVVGVRAVRSILDRHKDTLVSEIPKA